MSRQTDPNQVRLTGENSFISLSTEDKGPTTTRVSHWRVLLSPAGPGHTLFFQSELTDNQIRIYADNIALARWLQEEIEVQIHKPSSDQRIPVIQATFTKSGDPKSFWTESVRSDRDTIVLRWYDFGEPFIFHPESGSLPGVTHVIYSCLTPAKNAEVMLNERRALGRAFPKQEAERPSSTACLAWSETWLRPY